MAHRLAHVRAHRRRLDAAGCARTLRVFAEPGQRGSRSRSVAFGMRAPEDVASRPVDFRTNLEHEGGIATNGATAYRVINACVPAGGYADYRITVSGSSPVYGDMRSQDTIGEPREGGVLFTQIALADEVGAPLRALYGEQDGGPHSSRPGVVGSRESSSPSV